MRAYKRAPARRRRRAYARIPRAGVPTHNYLTPPPPLTRAFARARRAARAAVMVVSKNLWVERQRTQ